MNSNLESLSTMVTQVTMPLTKKSVGQRACEVLCPLGGRKEERGEGRIEESEREERRRRRGQEGGWGRGMRAGGTMGKRGIGADRGRDL